jgi:hypothetical protein
MPYGVFIDVLDRLITVGILCQPLDICVTRKSDVLWWVPSPISLPGSEVSGAAPKEDAFMKIWHQNELLVVVVMLVFIMQFYCFGKMNALLH